MKEFTTLLCKLAGQTQLPLVPEVILAFKIDLPKVRSYICLVVAVRNARNIPEN